ARASGCGACATGAARAAFDRTAGRTRLKLGQLVERARAWLAEDPDPETRAQLAPLVEAADEAALAPLFSTRLQFGTAGLRGPLGPGPARMNRALVRRAAAGLSTYLSAAV